MKSNFINIFSIFILAFIFCLPKSTWGQCDFKFEYSIESEDSLSGSNIILTYHGDAGNFSFQLYDLYQGKVVDKQLRTFKAGEKILLFEDVPPSTYTIYVTREDCSNYITIGGKYGLVVEDKK